MMSQEEQDQHETIKNIERAQWTINSGQLIKTIWQTIIIIIGIVGLLITAFNWWFTGKAVDKDAINDLKLQNIELKHIIQDNVIRDSVWHIQFDRKIDQLENTITGNHENAEDHFKLIEEKMKHFRAYSFFTEKRNNDGSMALVPYNR